MQPNENAETRHPELGLIHQYTSTEIKHILSPGSALLEHCMYIGTGRDFLEVSEKHPLELQRQLVAHSIKMTIHKYEKDSEKESWSQTIAELAQLVRDAELYDQIIILEYDLDAKNDHGNFSRMDVVILGKDSFDNDTIAIIEMKGWKTNILSEDKSKKNSGRVRVKYGNEVKTKPHPSSQAVYYKNMFGDTQRKSSNPNNQLNAYACAYMHNIDSWDSKRNNSVLFGEFSQKFRKQAPLYTKPMRHQLISRLVNQVGKGHGYDALRKLEDITLARKEPDRIPL